MSESFYRSFSETKVTRFGTARRQRADQARLALIARALGSPGQLLEIGPVNATSHKIDECIDIAALPRLSAIYTRLLEQLLPA